MRGIKVLSLLMGGAFLFSCAGKSKELERINLLEKRLSRVEKRLKEQEKLNEHLSRRIDSLAQEQEVIRAELNALKQELKKLKELKKKESLSYKEFYEGALKEYMSGNYERSLKLFDEFLRRYEKNELTDNAQFWLAMSYKKVGNLSLAKKILLNLEEKCRAGELPDCNKLPSVYLHLYFIYKKEGNLKRANLYKSKLKRRFPRSWEAKWIK